MKSLEMQAKLKDVFGFNYGIDAAECALAGYDLAHREIDTQNYLKLDDKYSEFLKPFLRLMEDELHANSDKGDRDGWLQMTPENALLEIYYHVSKLQKAMKSGDIELIKEHSADVANMSMMLLDIYNCLVENPDNCYSMQQRYIDY